MVSDEELVNLSAVGESSERLFSLPSEEDEVKRFKEVELLKRKSPTLKSCSFKLAKPSYERYQGLIKELDISFNKFCIDALRFYALARLDHIKSEKQRAPQRELDRFLSGLEENEVLSGNSDALEVLGMLKDALAGEGGVEEGGTEADQAVKYPKK